MKKNLMKSSGLATVTQLGRDTVRILTVAYGIGFSPTVEGQPLVSGTVKLGEQALES